MCDFNVATQEPFVKAFRKILGYHSVYPLMAVEKIKEKNAWQMYSKVNGVSPETANEVSKYIDAYNKDVSNAEDDEKDSFNIEDYIPKKYISLYEKSKEWQGITINLKVHACAFLLLEGDIRRKIGLISAISKTTGKRTLVACVEGKYLDSFGYCKNDFLIVDSVSLTKECFESIGRKVPSFDELREMIKEDIDTWDIYKKGITCCVNQVEKEETTKKVMAYKPQNLGELSSFIAAIRPGFKSLIWNFIERKPYTTGESKIDDILSDSYHYMIYQESIMKVLAYLGLDMKESYGVIKNISKKKLKREKLQNLKDELTEGWQEKIGDFDNFEKIWQVINDAAKYSFNCLSGSTIIYRLSNKKNLISLTIEEMYRICNDVQYAKETKHKELHQKYKNYGYGKALSLFADGKLHYNSIIGIYDAGIQDTYTVTTKTGKTIDCTMEHKFPTPNGKKPLKELKIGDRLFVKGVYVQEKFDTSLTGGNFELNYPQKGERGFQKNQNGASVLYKDGNRKNNIFENYQWICDSCHKKEHYKMGRTKTYSKGIPVYEDEIISIVYKTQEHTYNVSMADPAHNFVVNDGIVTSNSPHSLSMGGDSAYLAWFKAHYTVKFYEVAINHYQKKGNKDKIDALIHEINKFYGYRLGEFRFGQDNRQVNIDEKERIIYPNLTAVKNISQDAPIILYENRNKEFKNRAELYQWLMESKLNKTTLDILFRIGYFNKYGNPQRLIEEYAIYKENINKTVLTKSKIPEELLPEIIKCCGKETNKQLRDIDNSKLIVTYIKNAHIVPASSAQQARWQIELLGYTTITNTKASIYDYIVTNIKETKYGTVYAKIYNLHYGVEREYRCNKKYWSRQPLVVRDAIRVILEEKDKMKKNEAGNWVKTGEKITEIKCWKMLDNDTLV